MLTSLRRSVRFGLLTVIALACTGNARADDPPLPPIRCLADLDCLSTCQLEHLYRCAQPGPIPCGFLRGKSYYLPCETLAACRERMTNRIWLGKHFCPQECKSINQFCFGRIIRSQLYYAESWLDGKPAIILDYRNSSLLWFDVRDEMRMIAPGIYLGAMFLERHGQAHQRLFFALEEIRCGCH